MMRSKMRSPRNETHCKARNNAMIRCLPMLVLVAALACAAPLHADQLDNLAQDFWTWRASEMPVSTDDIPRLQRPSDWVPDWSPAAGIAINVNWNSSKHAGRAWIRQSGRSPAKWIIG
jgi:hypothetical protein